MAVTPDTTIKLLKVPIEIDNMNQLTFATLIDQYNYFNGCTKIEEEDLYYQRKDNYILFPAHIDTILEYNYCMYQNSNYSEKWFYAFITNMEYENDGTTKVYIETDVYQTWMFDITMKACFVEREHVNDDTIGKHTIPENLDIGEAVNYNATIDTALATCYLVVASDYNPVTKDQFAGIGLYNGSVTANQYHVFDLTKLNYAGYIDFLNYLGECNIDHHIKDIKDVFLAPVSCFAAADLIANNGSWTHEGVTHTYTFFTLQYNTSAKTETKTIPKVTSFTGLTLKNNKCFVYPYNYLLVTNNIGNSNIYKYEDFSNSSNATFEIQLALSVGCSGRIVPKNYKEIDYNYDEAISLGKYPTCGWSADSYTNWLTQNAINMPMKIAGTIASPLTTPLNATKLSQGGMITSTALSIAGLIGEFREASLKPNIEVTQNVGDVNYSAGSNTFVYKCMKAKDEYLKIIDSYFTMYGYKVNEVKIPNVTGRTYWNYVKTIDCNIEGDIPQNDLQKIKDIFNHGVTFWHDPTKFLDYTQNNTIVT